MPNLSFDVFYDQDFVNFTVSRGGAAPKAKPAWYESTHASYTSSLLTIFQESQKCT
jgi:hypothetical protein